STSTWVAVPASVTIPANSVSTSFSVTAGSISSDTSAVITGALGTSNRSATLTLWSTPVLSSLACTPLTLTVGSSSACTVTLSKAAGSLAVGLSSSSPALTLPPSINVPQGANAATFTAGAQQAAGGWIVVTATLNGASKTNVFRISNAVSSGKRNAVGARLESVSCTPRVLSAKSTGVCRLTVDNVSDSDAVEVHLSSSNESVKVPTTVTTMAGQSSLEFQIDALESATDGAAVVIAQLGENTVREAVTLRSSQQLKLPRHQIVRFGENLRVA